jgi:hypothetical protein
MRNRRRICRLVTPAACDSLRRAGKRANWGMTLMTGHACGMCCILEKSDSPIGMDANG